MAKDFDLGMAHDALKSCGLPAWVLDYATFAPVVTGRTGAGTDAVHIGVTLAPARALLADGQPKDLFVAAKFAGYHVDWARVVARQITEGALRILLTGKMETADGVFDVQFEEAKMEKANG